jgi:lysosomal acid phosphatase
LQIAHWLEMAKMRSTVSSNLLGGLLLGDLLSRIHHTKDNFTAGHMHKRLFLVSSHYNTQLGLLAALGIDQSPAAEKIAWLRYAMCPMVP